MLKLLFLASMRTLWVVVITWIQLVRDITSWHINMCWRMILWTVNVTTLPFRALGALQREKMMRRLLQEMQSGLENLAWDNKKLHGHLQMVVKERHQMESILAELEEDHDKAISKIELLENEEISKISKAEVVKIPLRCKSYGIHCTITSYFRVKHVKVENQRLKEDQSKGHWDPITKTDPKYDEQITFDPDEKEIKQAQEIERPPKHHSSKAKDRASQALPNPTTLIKPLTSSNVDPNEALNQQRKNAVVQSVFSAILSLLVGAIIWQAKDPCVPLVMALFTVVGMSLRSVVVFFSTIRNRPASDAVTLLSVNWFILGALAYPALPGIARALSPVVLNSLVRVLGWLR